MGAGRDCGFGKRSGLGEKAREGEGRGESSQNDATPPSV